MNVPERSDIVIIGGGISGLGVSLEAALNGFSAVLVERAALAGATSNNSLRIIHGGIRYLQQLQLRRVLQSIRAQAELLEDFPDIVKPLPCIMPLAAGGLRSRLPMTCAGFLYSALAKQVPRAAGRSEVVGAEFVKLNIPRLAPLAPRGAFVWQDAVLADPRALVEAIAEKAVACGSVHAENSRVSKVAREGNEFVVGIARDGAGAKIRAKVVVDVSGPWLDRLLDTTGERNAPLAEGWCKAFNVVLSKQLDAQYAIGLHSPQKRLFFAVPRGNQTALGTGYFAHQGEPETASVAPQEIEAFIADFRATWPEAAISSSDVVSVESGILPMKFVGPFGPELYGEEQILDRSGYFSVMSTKYTTFREQARKVITGARRYLR